MEKEAPEGVDETQKLGGNIELSGFRDLDSSEAIVVKKIVGNYVKKFSGLTDKFQSFKVTLKKVHEREKSAKYELHALLMAGERYSAEIVERNLFVGLDTLLKKIEGKIKE